MAYSVDPDRISSQVDALDDHSMRESVHTVLEWVRAAAERNHGIVGFYH
jgi:tRNA threonylcarbamoyladenosine modification (KEOPS) complex  Pcc1 subunit